MNGRETAMPRLDLAFLASALAHRLREPVPAGR